MSPSLFDVIFAATSLQRRTRLHVPASVLALALAALTAPALAQQTGGNGGGFPGFIGGSTSATDGSATNGANGVTTADGWIGGGGGGGAGLSGGMGGSGESAGGAGGATPGADGADGVTGEGGGGGGGAHGAVGSLAPAGPVKGGNGGNGAEGLDGGGGGGGGGYGVFVTGPNVSVTATQTITGGKGGNGGEGNPGGAGGSGGVGMFFAGSGSLINQSAIQGGNGGAGGYSDGTQGVYAAGGAAGAGVVGANLSIDNTAGTIAAGWSGNAVPLIGDAIRFTGGANTLTLAGSGGLTGNIAITAVNSTLTINHSADVTLANVITGSGSLIHNATTALILTGNNTHTGGTTNVLGTLQIGNGGGTGALAGDITNDALLVFNRANNTTFGGVISGDGDVTKTGGGRLTLTGTSIYEGATTVLGGSLVVNGSIASSSMTVVNASGTLGGIGTVGNTVVNGGTLAPGSTFDGQIGPVNFIGLLTVQGQLVMTSAATYRVDVSPTGASRVNVSGTADLGGATVNANFATGSYVRNTTTIVNATAGLGGSTFGAVVNTNLPTSFKTGLSYDANNAYLNLTLDLTALGADPTAPSNHGRVGRAVTDFFNRTGGIPLVFGTLDTKGLSQAAGEIGPGGQQTSFNAATMFMGMMSDPFAAGRGEAAPGALPYADEAMAYARKRAPTDAFASMHRKAPLLAPQERWNVWAAGFGGSQTTDGNAATGSNTSKSSIYGMAVGADYWFSPFTVAGVSMAGGGTNFSVDGGGSGRSDLFQFGGFVRHNIGSVYVSAAAAYGWQNITTDRVVTSGGFDQLRANFNANSYSGRFEVGNRFVAPWIGGIGLTPYAAFQVTAFDLPSYAENVVAGSGMFALSYAGKTALSPRSELGLRTDKSFALNDAILTLRGRAAWAHDTNRDRSASATFQSLPGASFIVNGASLAKHTALASATAELKWMNGWSVAGTFEGEFSDVTKSYAGKGVVRYAW